MMNQKALHRHAAPVMILGAGLLIVSGIALIGMRNPNVGQQNITQLLTLRLFTIKPAANGLFHIARYTDANTQANLNALSGQKNSFSEIGEAGRVAQLNAVVNGAN